MTAVIQSDGTRVDVGYDPSGRTSSVTHADGQLLLAYDAVNGTLRSVTGPAGMLSYSHDGPLFTGETWSGVVSGQVGFTYDNNFQITAEAVNGGNSVSYGYDADGLLVSAGALTLSRDAQRGLVASSQIGAVGDAYVYNDLGEITSYTASVNGAPILALSYTRDAAGRISQTADTTQGTSTTLGYGYDDGARLATTTRNGVPESTYTYDANNNRLSQATDTRTTTATYDDEDHLLAYGTATYAYSSHGDLQSRTDNLGMANYKYDALGNLLRVTLPSGTVVDYVIDAQNRRIAKEVNGTLIQSFLYSNQQNVVAELDASGAVLSRFVYGTSVVVPNSMTKGGATYRIISDGLGSPRLVIDVASGSVVQRIDYDEFGNVLADTNPGFQPFGFAGGLYDTDTKLVRFGARDYDPQTGRWTTKDPIRFVGGGSNLYAYVSADPVNFRDPSGLTTAVVVFDDGLDSHAVVHIDNGGHPILYDPSGSYVVNGHRSDSNDTFAEEEANLPDYLHFWAAHDRSNPNVFQFDTTPEQEAEIAKRIEEYGAGGFFGCSLGVSSVLQGIGPFRNLKIVRWPPSLAKQLRKLMQVEARKRMR